jgi:hypothetical protein
MSKKSRRQRRPNLPAEAFSMPGAVAKPAGDVSVAGVPANTAAPGRRESVRAAVQAKLINWKEEYGEVMGDLKRTAILATGLLAVMIVLSFIIH